MRPDGGLHDWKAGKTKRGGTKKIYRFHQFHHGSCSPLQGGLEDSGVEVDHTNVQKLFITSRGKTALQDSEHLVAGLIFAPHGSSEDLVPVDKSSATVVMGGEKQHCLNADITLEQLEETMLPMAVDHFTENPGARTYQVLWKSMHGGAYIHVAKEKMKMRPTQKIVRGARRGKMLRRRVQEIHSQLNVIPLFLGLWFAQAPLQLKQSIMDWIRKEEENQLVPSSVHLRL